MSGESKKDLEGMKIIIFYYLEKITRDICIKILGNHPPGFLQLIADP